METSAETSRLRKILSFTHKSLECIQRPDGIWTETISETLELLLDTNFPWSVTLGGSLSGYATAVWGLLSPDS